MRQIVEMLSEGLKCVTGIQCIPKLGSLRVTSGGIDLSHKYDQKAGKRKAIVIACGIITLILASLALLIVGIVAVSRVIWTHKESGFRFDGPLERREQIVYVDFLSTAGYFSAQFDTASDGYRRIYLDTIENFQELVQLVQVVYAILSVWLVARRYTTQVGRHNFMGSAKSAWEMLLWEKPTVVLTAGMKRLRGGATIHTVVSAALHCLAGPAMLLGLVIDWQIGGSSSYASVQTSTGSRAIISFTMIWFGIGATYWVGIAINAANLVLLMYDLFRIPRPVYRIGVCIDGTAADILLMDTKCLTDIYIGGCCAGSELVEPALLSDDRQFCLSSAAETDNVGHVMYDTPRGYALELREGVEYRGDYTLHNNLGFIKHMATQPRDSVGPTWKALVSNSQTVWLLDIIYSSTTGCSMYRDLSEWQNKVLEDILKKTALWSEVYRQYQALMHNKLTDWAKMLCQFNWAELWQWNNWIISNTQYLRQLQQNAAMASQQDQQKIQKYFHYKLKVQALCKENDFHLEEKAAKLQIKCKKLYIIRIIYKNNTYNINLSENNKQMKRVNRSYLKQCHRQIHHLRLLMKSICLKFYREEYKL